MTPQELEQKMNELAAWTGEGLGKAAEAFGLHMDRIEALEAEVKRLSDRLTELAQTTFRISSE